MLDVDQLVTMCVHMNKQETLRMAEHKLTQIIHLKHTLDLVEPLRGTLAHCKNLLFVAYHDVKRKFYFSIIALTVDHGR